MLEVQLIFREQFCADSTTLKAGDAKDKVVMSSNLHQLREGKFGCLMVFTSKWGSNLRDLDGIKRLKIV